MTCGRCGCSHTDAIGQKQLSTSCLTRRPRAIRERFGTPARLRIGSISPRSSKPSRFRRRAYGAETTERNSQTVERSSRLQELRTVIAPAQLAAHASVARPPPGGDCHLSRSCGQTASAKTVHGAITARSGERRHFQGTLCLRPRPSSPQRCGRAAWRNTVALCKPSR